MSILAGIMVPHPPLIIPSVGHGQEKQIQPTIDAYGRAIDFLIAKDCQLLVVTTPHSVMYADYFHISPGTQATGSFASFSAPDTVVRVRYDKEFSDELSRQCAAAGLPAGHQGQRDAALDHATMIPLWFWQRHDGPDIPIVRIGLSGLPLARHYELGMVIARTAAALDRRVGFIASGDLSHKCRPEGPYGFSAYGPEYDRRIMADMGQAAFGNLLCYDDAFCEQAAECGHRSFTIMAGAFDGMAVKATALSHQDTFGVGYGVCTFEPQGPDPARHFLDGYRQAQAAAASRRRAQQDELVRLARKTVETWVGSHRKIGLPSDLQGELRQRRAGAFVTLYKDGQLRGCIGTISPVTPCLGQEIIDNAISACSRDPRFDEVQADELADIVYSVDVLGPLQDIKGPQQLDVARYGVVVANGTRRGLLLPDLDGVDTVEQQIAIARRKAGIEPDEPVTLQRFEVVRHH